MFTLIITLLFTLLSFSTASKVKCERELEAVVYTPPNYYYDYLLKLENQFRQFAPIMFTPQNATSVFTFINTYGVEIEVTDAFGYNWSYVRGQTNIDYNRITTLTPNQARAMAVGRAYMKYSDSLYSLYSFRIFNSEGKFLLITFYLQVARPSP